MYFKRPEGLGLWRPECSEGATSGLRISYERRDHWMRSLTDLDHTSK